MKILNFDIQISRKFLFIKVEIIFFINNSTAELDKIADNVKYLINTILTSPSAQF